LRPKPSVLCGWARCRARDRICRADRKGPNYVTGLTGEEIASVLCKAVGHWGSGAEYLMQTVDHLERLGIRDTSLCRLQQLGAQQLVDLRAAAR